MVCTPWTHTHIGDAVSYTHLDVYKRQPFDLESIDFLQGLRMPFWKIPSGDITNLPYLLKLAHTGMPVLMSTGMSDIAEVKAAVNALQHNGAGSITLLHCNTEYPTPFEDVNPVSYTHLCRVLYLELALYSGAPY